MNFLCSKCGSGKVEEKTTLETATTTIKCLSCGWEGDGGLVAPDIEDPLGIALEISKAYFQHLYKLAAIPIGLAMVRAGVVGGSETHAILGRVLKATIVAAHKATLMEIESIQKEKPDAN